MDNHITEHTLNEIFEELLGQSFTESIKDRQGCSMGRGNGVWLCPKLLTEIVTCALNESGVQIIKESIEASSVTELETELDEHPFNVDGATERSAEDY